MKHRLILAEDATQKLAAMGPMVTPEAISTVGALRTGQIDVASWQKMAPYILAGFVQGPKGWMTPQDAALEQQSTQAETRQKNASAGQSEANANYTNSVKPAVEMGKVANQAAVVDQRAKAQNDNLQFRKDKQAEDTQTKRDLAKQSIEAAAARSASQAGYSDEKAYHQAVQDANAEYKNAVLTDADAYKARVDELYKKYAPKGDSKKPMDAAERARQFLNKPK